MRRRECHVRSTELHDMSKQPLVTALDAALASRCSRRSCPLRLTRDRTTEALPARSRVVSQPTFIEQRVVKCKLINSRGLINNYVILQVVLTNDSLDILCIT